ncbi:hypothetical protein J8F10_18025 [Gemmata sp. G18]|uniref:Uncharacterized protein n=1 Tax=Gemmata palustris TaxID=2822762 RepID=A0ABS5BTW7_9BACT|nr:hypothetical protein [Gemmata palustris]MBP3957164.1 hypothetical protein [Gemmata palustris]
MNDQTPKPTTPPAQTPPASALPAAKVPVSPTVLASGVTEKGRMLYAMYEKRFGKPAGS